MKNIAPHQGERKPLPPGLDPVTAGRFGLWLLGRRSHIRAQKRTFFALRVPGCGIVQRFAALLLPWTIEEYPGYRKALAELMQVGVRSIDDWLYRPDRLPRKHAKRFETICRARAAEFTRLADEFAAWKADQPERVRIRRGRKGG